MKISADAISKKNRLDKNLSQTNQALDEQEEGWGAASSGVDSGDDSGDDDDREDEDLEPSDMEESEVSDK